MLITVPAASVRPACQPAVDRPGRGEGQGGGEKLPGAAHGSAEGAALKEH